MSRKPSASELQIKTVSLFQSDLAPPGKSEVNEKWSLRVGTPWGEGTIIVAGLQRWLPVNYTSQWSHSCVVPSHTEPGLVLSFVVTIRMQQKWHCASSRSGSFYFCPHEKNQVPYWRETTWRSTNRPQLSWINQFKVVRNKSEVWQNQVYSPIAMRETAAQRDCGAACQTNVKRS